MGWVGWSSPCSELNSIKAAPCCKMLLNPNLGAPAGPHTENNVLGNRHFCSQSLSSHCVCQTKFMSEILCCVKELSPIPSFETRASQQH